MTLERAHAVYALSDELSRIDFAKVTEWLTGSYWSPGIGRAEVERGARHSSIVVGAYDAGGVLVGYGRAASDAHGVYAPLGFGPHPEPNSLMTLRKPWPREI